VLEVPVTVTAEGGQEVTAASEEKPAKKGRKAKTETEESVDEASSEAAAETAE
jgi:hypothetical protein